MFVLIHCKMLIVALQASMSISVLFCTLSNVVQFQNPNLESVSLDSSWYQHFYDSWPWKDIIEQRVTC